MRKIKILFVINLLIFSGYISCQVNYKLPDATNKINIPVSIDKTGKTDVSLQLNRFFSSLPDSTEVHFPLKGIYLVEGILQIKNKKYLKINGNGSTIVSKTNGSQIPVYEKKASHNWPRSRQHVEIYNSSHIILKDLKILGPHKKGGIDAVAYVKSLEAQHGINIYGSDHIVIDSVEIQEVYGDFIYIGDGAGNRKSTHITVINCDFRKNGRQGIAITMADSVFIINNNIANVRRASVDIEPNTAKSSVTNVFITRNRFGAGRLLWIAGSGKGTVDNIHIENNYLFGRNAQIILGNEAQQTSNIYITGNESVKTAGNPQGAIWKIINVQGFNARDNIIPAQKNRNMYLIGSRNSIIYLGENTINNGFNRIKNFD